MNSNRLISRVATSVVLALVSMRWQTTATFREMEWFRYVTVNFLDNR